MMCLIANQIPSVQVMSIESQSLHYTTSKLHNMIIIITLETKLNNYTGHITNDNRMDVCHYSLVAMYW